MSSLKILIAEDEGYQRKILADFLASLGHSVTAAASGTEALERIEREGKDFDLLLTDLQMPGLSGIELIKRAQELSPHIDCMIVTAHGSIESAIHAIRLGAFDYLLKPVELDDLRFRIKKLLNLRKIELDAEQMEKDNRALRGDATPVAESPVMIAILAELEKAASKDVSVILHGETGVGKEVLARHLHERSARGEAKGPFVAVNCSAIPAELLESEFFGHEKGAFTGAGSRRIGLFERASGGTLFLDEIGEMDLRLQPKILRALEERKITRVGGTREIAVDIRLVAATHRDLKKLVSEGAFREDLYYRLNVVQIAIPPLRARLEELPGLVKHLAERYSAKLNTHAASIDPEYVEALRQYGFPGNVRELSNIVERSLIFMKEGRLTRDCLPPEFRAERPPELPPEGAAENFAERHSLAEMARSFEKWVIAATLRKFSGDVDACAQALGVSRSGLYAKLSKHGMKAEEHS